MPLKMQTPPEEMVDEYEVRLGREYIKHHFAEPVRISEAAKLAKAWLDIYKAPTP